MANFKISLNQGNPDLASSFAGNDRLRGGSATADGLASAPPEARVEVDHRSQYMAGMSADEAQTRYKDLISGKHT
jgi:hypothetical protein